MITIKNKDIIFFDGICILCSKIVRWILKRDKNAHFLFCSLQSEFARSFIEERGLTFPKESIPNSILVYQEDKIFDKSEAVLLILKKLNIYKVTVGILKLLPKIILDGAYSIIAKSRYKWFGQSKVCFLPDPDYRNRFIDNYTLQDISY